MNMLIFSAALVMIMTGVVHSFLGEYLIFRHLRESGVVPTNPVPPLKSRHIRILWASWHLASVFGWLAAAVLVMLSQLPTHDRFADFILTSIAVSCLMGALLVLFATRGRHPGWIALMLSASLTWLATVT